MQFPQRFSALPEYAFPRLRRLLRGHAARRSRTGHDHRRAETSDARLSRRIVAEHAHEFALYPPNEGAPELRAAIADWLARRYGVAVDPETEMMPLNGTREGLFNAALALSPETQARRAAGDADAEPLLPGLRRRRPGRRRRADRRARDRCHRLSARLRRAAGGAARPGDALLSLLAVQPAGRGGRRGLLARLIALAERHDFRILADECYSRDLPRHRRRPARLAMARRRRRRSRARGRSSSRCPSARTRRACARASSRAGRARSPRCASLRAYGGAPLPLPLQRAATALWRDEAHVDGEPRALPGEIRARGQDIRQHARLHPARRPASSSGSAPATARRRRCRLWREAGVRVLPGAYLGRAGAGRRNPGSGLHPGRAGGAPQRGRARARRDPRHARGAAG